MLKWSKTRYLLITANPGAGGHRLARLTACLNNVHWYSSEHNGINPWDTPQLKSSTPDFIAGPRKIAPYHFQRIMGKNLYVPHIGERTIKFWNNINEWKGMFNERMERITPPKEKYLMWLTHDDPNYLITIFPEAIIINLIDSDPTQVAERYLKTTAKFPYYYAFHGQHPRAYITDYDKELSYLHAQFPNMTFEDYWLYTNKKVYQWNELLKSEYKNYIHKEIQQYTRLRKQCNHSNVLNITWLTAKNELVKFLDSTLEGQYEKLV